MAIARLTGQDALGAVASGTSVTANYPGATTSGNLLIATLWGGGNGGSVSGFTGTTVGLNSSTATIGLFYKIADGTETTITGTTASSGIGKLHIYEYSGAANPVDLDVALSANGNGTGNATSFSSASITTTLADSLIFCVFGVNGTATTPLVSTMNIRQQDVATTRLWDADLNDGSTHSSFTGNTSWTNTLKASAIIGAFKAASGSPTVNSGFFGLM